MRCPFPGTDNLQYPRAMATTPLNSPWQPAPYIPAMIPLAAHAPLGPILARPQDPRYMATTALNSPRVVVLDIRFPTIPVVELAKHQVRFPADSPQIPRRFPASGAGHQWV